MATAPKPLTAAVLHILLALSSGERHGYGIMKEVEDDSEGKVTMGPGTLYGTIGRMLAAGLVEASDARRDARLDDERRVYYRLTAQGEAALKAELERYRTTLTVAERKRQSRGLAHGT